MNHAEHGNWPLLMKKKVWMTYHCVGVADFVVSPPEVEGVCRICRGYREDVIDCSVQMEL